MSRITDRFVQEAEHKQIKFTSKIIERTMKDRQGNDIPHEQRVLQTGLRISEEKTVHCSVVIHETDEIDYVNYQMMYSRIGLVTDRLQLPNILEKLNELNSVKAGYYHFIVTPDGELQMRNLGIIGIDPIPTITTFLHGGRILRALMPELEAIEGLDLTERSD